MNKMIILGVLLMASQGFASEYLVKYRSASALKSLSSLSMGKAQFRITGQHEVGSYVKINVTPANEARVLVDLLTRPDIEYVVPNAKMHAFTSPVQITQMREQWAITKVQAEKAWQRAGNKGHRNITVAVIDTGVDYNHPNLAPNMVQGYDFKQNDNDPMDVTGAQNPGIVIILFEVITLHHIWS